MKLFTFLLLLLLGTILHASRLSAQLPLQAAALEFGVTPSTGGPTSSKVGAPVQNVAGPLKTTVTLLKGGTPQVCLITPHMNLPPGHRPPDPCQIAAAARHPLRLHQPLLRLPHEMRNRAAMSSPPRRWRPLELQGGNLPEQLLPQTDLFGAHHDDNWRQDFPFQA